jgi:hypothetical protein
LVRGSGVVVLDLLFPQLLASNSIVSLRFGRFGLVFVKNRREKPSSREIRFRARSTGPQTGRPSTEPGRPGGNRTGRSRSRSNRTPDRAQQRPLLRPRHPAISTTTTTTTIIAGITCRSPCNPSSFCDLSHRALLV